MARKIKIKTHKTLKERIFKNFRKRFIIRRRTSRRRTSLSKNLNSREPSLGADQLIDRMSDRTNRLSVRTDRLSDATHELLNNWAQTAASDYTYERPIKKRYSKSAYSRYYKKSYGRSSYKYAYFYFSNRTNKSRLLKKSILYLLISAIILYTVNFVLSNANFSLLNGLGHLIKNTEARIFKEVFNNVLPIINITYNSGNIGNPISMQLKALIKNIFSFDIGIPITILNAQSPFLYTYYEKEYIPSLAGEHWVDNKEDGFYKYDEETGSLNNSGKSGESGKSEENSTDYDTGEDLASRGNKQVKNGRGDNIEEVEDGIISYYYYEGEEEKLEEPKENISSGQKINIMNMTNYRVSDSEINKLLKEPLNFKLDDKGPQILILHTHSSESFVKKLEDVNVRGAPIFSRNPQENVIRVGHELSEQLKRFGFDVIHNGTEHDIPDHNKSYINAYDTIERYLKSYPSIKVILDIHRDGLSKDQPKLRVVKQIDGKNVAQIMFVIGTNHPNWKENFKLALKLQENLNSKNPGIARHIYLSNNRYNQHFTSGSLIVEIGGEGNLLSECIESTKYLARAISEVIK